MVAPLSIFEIGVPKVMRKETRLPLEYDFVLPPFKEVS